MWGVNKKMLIFCCNIYHNYSIMTQYMGKAMKNLGAFEPKKCWVGETQKICYASREEAEVAAKVAQFDHGAPELSVYKCEYGDHWHLSSRSQN